MNILNSTTTRPTQPTPKPTRSPRQMATGERLRQISEQGNELFPQFLDALDRGHSTTAHHLTDRLLGLYHERDAVMAEAQDDAGTSWRWTA